MCLLFMTMNIVQERNTRPGENNFLCAHKSLITFHIKFSTSLIGEMSHSTCVKNECTDALSIP